MMKPPETVWLLRISRLSGQFWNDQVRAVMISRVLVTGDLLRPYPVADGTWESATWRNIRWLHALVGPAIRATGREVAMVSWDETLGPSEGVFFDAPLAYHRAEGTVSFEGWARLAAEPIRFESVKSMLCQPFENALAIGYEMSDAMIAALAEREIPFIDVSLHPIRFLEDLVFALRTNIRAFHDTLIDHKLSDVAAQNQAALIQAKAAWMKKPLPLPPGSMLVLGQVDHDRALLQRNGGFHSLGDHLKRLHQLCCDHPKVLFKPHPYDKARSPSQMAVKRLPAIQWTNANFYHLLSQPEIEGVVALNSSGLVEARYFGKASENLAPFLYAYSDTPPGRDFFPGGAVPQNGDWIETSFWRQLLDGTSRAATVPAPPNRLRRTMNADWGYGFVDRVVA
jgi:hypothetical protein